MWYLRRSNTLLRSAVSLPQRWMIRTVKSNRMDAQNEPNCLPSVKGYVHTSSVATTIQTMLSLQHCARFAPPGVLFGSSRMLLLSRLVPSKLQSVTPFTARWFSKRPLTAVEKYFRKRTREKIRKLREAKASGKKPPIKITSGMKKYKKQRKYYIMELLRRQMMEEERRPSAAPQLPILFPYRQYDIIPRPAPVRKRQRLTLRQKVYCRLYDLQQDRLAQKNPLHSQCRTCPVCQRRFEGRQKMLHHLLHFLPCARTLPVETLNALIAQKEYAEHYDAVQRPIQFKTKEQFR
jgi:hypothetical protein